MKNSQKGFAIPLIIAIIAVLVIGGGAYVVLQNKQAQKEDVKITSQNNVPTINTFNSELLSSEAMVNSNFKSANESGKEREKNVDFGIKMYAPKGWFYGKSNYFGADILISNAIGRNDYTTQPDSHGTIVVIVYDAQTIKVIASSSDSLIDKVMKGTIESYKTCEKVRKSLPDELPCGVNPETAINNVKKVSINGISGISYDYGNYFGSSGYGKTVILKSNGAVIMLVAETASKEFWNQNKDKMLASLDSFGVFDSKNYLGSLQKGKNAFISTDKIPFSVKSNVAIIDLTISKTGDVVSIFIDGTLQLELRPVADGIGTSTSKEFLVWLNNPVDQGDHQVGFVINNTNGNRPSTVVNFKGARAGPNSSDMYKVLQAE